VGCGVWREIVVPYTTVWGILLFTNEMGVCYVVMKGDDDLLGKAFLQSHVLGGDDSKPPFLE